MGFRDWGLGYRVEGLGCQKSDVRTSGCLEWVAFKNGESLRLSNDYGAVVLLELYRGIVEKLPTKSRLPFFRRYMP